MTAQTPQLAVKMAERIHPGWQAKRVHVVLEVVGKCCRCGMVLFEGHGRGRERNGKLTCGECHV